ncbi:MAG: hypothetical protein ACI8V2_003171 [Candidatus Latescibacterota bacterium]|jgi:hypothetical protein
MRTAIVLSFLVLLFSNATDVHARSQRVNQIPSGSVNSCANCHVNPSGGGARNAFGQVVESGFLSGSGANASVVWNASLAGMDSDGDGFSNGTELGDPDGDGTPTIGAQVTNPGLASSLPQVVNNAPTIASIDAKGVDEGAVLTFSVTATDPDNDTVTLTASNLPTGATFANGEFTWTPDFDQSGSFTVSFGASDGTAQASTTVQITVANTNRVPVFDTIAAQTVKEGTALSFTVGATDPDGDAVTLAAEGLPTGATLSGGQFAWTPGFDQSGSITVSFTASDGTGQALASVQIAVEDAQRPLTLSSISPTATLLVHPTGDTVRVSVAAESPDRGGLTYTWLVNGATQVETRASLLVTVSEGTTDDVISVTASDGTDSLSQNWTVTKALLGDFDVDKDVDFSDFLIFVGAFGKTSADPAFIASADINGNGTVDFPDFLTFVRFFGLRL